MGAQRKAALVLAVSAVLAAAMATSGIAAGSQPPGRAADHRRQAAAPHLAVASPLPAAPGLPLYLTGDRLSAAAVTAVQFARPGWQRWFGPRAARVRQSKP